MSRPPAFVILADEAATWRIGGLAQLDRVILALNEWVQETSPAEIVQAVIFWRPDVAASSRWLPRHPRITHVRLTESVRSAPAGAQVLDVRLFIQPKGMSDFMETVAPVTIAEMVEDSVATWNEFNLRLNAAIPSKPRGAALWHHLSGADSIARCEQQLLGRSGKSQDGIVSRFLNRPLSRRASRFLLRFDISPTLWSMSLFALPLGAFFCLARGDYGGIVAGAVLFQLYSILDGCDGEIARATYQESERGGRIDDFLDMLGSIVFVVGLGLGLFRSGSSLYLLEGLVCAGVIAANEWSLRSKQNDDQPASTKLAESLYPRHRRLLARNGLGFLGENSQWWIVQFTKRDVAIFFFLILALADYSPWILHLWLIVSATTLGLSTRSSAGKTGSTQPTP